MENQTEENL